MSDYENRVKARNLLRVLLPKAEAADITNVHFGFKSQPSFLATVPFARRNNLAGIDLFEDSQGKWIADIVMKEVPRGYADRIGISADHAYNTRQEAVEAVTYMLAHILKTPDEIRDPVFVFFDYSISVPRKIIEDVAQSFSLQLEHMRAKYIAQGLLHVGKYATRLDTLTEDEQRELHAVIIIAMLNNVVKWPPTVAGEPYTQERLAAMPLDELAKLTQYRVEE